MTKPTGTAPTVISCVSSKPSPDVSACITKLVTSTTVRSNPRSPFANTRSLATFDAMRRATATVSPSWTPTSNTSPCPMEAMQSPPTTTEAPKTR